MSLSFRNKLFLLTAISLLFFATPLLMISYYYVEGYSLSMEKRTFQGVMHVVDENLHSNFMHLLAWKVEEVRRHKTALANSAAVLSAMLDKYGGSLEALREQRAELKNSLIRHSDFAGLRTYVFKMDEWLQASPFRGGTEADFTDVVGRSLPEILAALPAAGSFAVLHPSTHAQEPSDKEGMLLYHFRPYFLHGGQKSLLGGARPDLVILATVPLAELEKKADHAVDRLVESLEERFRSLKLHEGSYAVLIGSNGELLTRPDLASGPFISAIPPILKTVREGKHAGTVVSLPGPQGIQEPFLAYGAYSRPFNWHTVLAVPMSAISEPSASLLKRLTISSLVAGLAALGCVLLLLAGVVRPLRMLTQKISALPEVDFSLLGVSASIDTGLPLQRKDEIGELARSFSHMARQLHVNIRERMDANSAKERLQGELKAAREIQHGILPSPEFSPCVFGLASSAILEPAKEIGGDLYDFFIVPDGRYAFVLGDVSGKGVPAALFMAMTVTLVRYTLNSGLDPAKAMTRINAMLGAHNPSSMFVTLFLVLYDHRTGLLEYANGGHNPPYIISADGTTDLRILDGLSGPLVGVIPDAEYTLFTGALSPGELCFLYTDGVTEAVDASHKLYGNDCLVAYLKSRRSEKPKELITGIYTDIERFRGDTPPFDDITMLAFARR